MAMNSISLSEKLGRNLGSRKRAAEFREWLLAQGQIVLDFSGVELISHSFADELFGKLAQSYGTEIFKTRIVIKNLKPEDRALLHFVIRERLSTAQAG